jgi:hypothetical protein
MNRIALHAVRDALAAQLATLNAVTIHCRSCASWQEEHCTRFDAVPPPDVVQAGCEEWEWDRVPF